MKRFFYSRGAITMLHYYHVFLTLARFLKPVVSQVDEDDVVRKTEVGVYGLLSNLASTAERYGTRSAPFACTFGGAETLFHTIAIFVIESRLY